MLVGMSTMLAIQTQLQEIELSDEEAKKFLEAAGRVAGHYGTRQTQKAVDIATLLGVSVQIFGTRAVAINLTLRARRMGHQVTVGGGNVIRPREFAAPHTQPAASPAQPPVTGPGMDPGLFAEPPGYDDGGGYTG